MPHFEADEYRGRADRLRSAMAEHGYDGMLLFAQESMYWLTGYDTFGFCFFQCLVVPRDGDPVLLTRSADLRQARFTSNISESNIRIWKDGADANPALELRALVQELGLTGGKLGVELETHGLTAANGRKLDAAMDGVVTLEDASLLVPALRLIKSPAEIDCARRAGELCDAALDAAMPVIRGGADEGAVLAAMHGAIFAAGGDYAANPYILGSGEGALLCRYYSGRRTLSTNDQLTLEWAGAWRQYHAARMATVVVGEARPQHAPMFEAGKAALLACEEQLQPGRTFGDVFQAHADTMDAAGLREHRLNACGYSLGARFAPSWMDTFMFYEGNPQRIEPNMVLFLHMILMDSDSNTSMCVGRTSVVSESGTEPITGRDIEMLTA